MITLLLLLIIVGTLMTLFSMAKVAGKADRELERLFNETYDKDNICELQINNSVVSRIT